MLGLRSISSGWNFGYPPLSKASDFIASTLVVFDTLTKLFSLADFIASTLQLFSSSHELRQGPGVWFGGHGADASWSKQAGKTGAWSKQASTDKDWTKESEVDGTWTKESGKTSNWS